MATPGEAACRLNRGDSLDVAEAKSWPIDADYAVILESSSRLIERAGELTTIPGPDCQPGGLSIDLLPDQLTITKMFDQTSQIYTLKLETEPGEEPFIDLSVKYYLGAGLTDSVSLSAYQSGFFIGTSTRLTPTEFSGDEAKQAYRALITDMSTFLL